jgi:hypothetical protein
MNVSTVSYKRKAILSLVIGILFLLACFIFRPLGAYVVWIAGGGSAYFLFLTVYYLIFSFQSKQPFHKVKKETSQGEEMKTYIRSQIPILISIFLFGILIVVIVLFFTQ